MKETDKKLARELKKKIELIVPVLDYKVYGSRARGDNDDDSDPDVFIEVDMLDMLDMEIKEKIREIAWEIGFENSIHISPIIFTRWELEESPLRASFIVENINRDGISF